MENLISILVAALAGLGLLLFRKSKQNISLKAEKDLTERTESSKVVDDQNSETQKEIDSLEGQIKSEPEGPDKFWDEYKRKGE